MVSPVRILTRGHIAGGGFFHRGMKVAVTIVRRQQCHWLQQSCWFCYWLFAAYTTAV